MTPRGMKIDCIYLELVEGYWVCQVQERLNVWYEDQLETLSSSLKDFIKERKRKKGRFLN